MSALAEVLARSGWSVSGSDLVESALTRHLCAAGVAVTVGHDPEAAAAADVLVHSTAVPAADPERRAARERGVPEVRRGAMLARLMATRRGVAVAGSHGKTSTTALLTHVLETVGLDPTALVGGTLAGRGSGARVGTGALLVAEADESDGSFLELEPELALITNVDREHLEQFSDHEGLVEAFVHFLGRVRPGGCAVTCLDDPGVRAVLGRARGTRHVSYGMLAGASWQGRVLEIGPFRSAFEVRRDGDLIGQATVPLPGRQFVLNAIGVVAAAAELGVEPGEACRALGSFPGVERRFTRVGEVGDVLVVDDYGHHPAEVRCTLEAARAAFDRRLVVVFQPHRYTRTRDLLQEFAAAFGEADVLILTEVYAAGDRPLPGADGSALHAAVLRHREAEYIPRLADLPGRLLECVRPGDLVLTLGAGDVHEAGPALLECLGSRAGEALR